MNDFTRLRFVILWHRVGKQLERTDQDHFDLMFAEDAVGSLRTFSFAPGSLSRPTDPAAVLSTTCQSLPPHRRHYLDHEGPVAGDRGYVRQIVAGTFDVTRDDPSRYEVTLRVDDRGVRRIDRDDPRPADLDRFYALLSMRRPILRFQRMVLEGPGGRDSSVWHLELDSGR